MEMSSVQESYCPECLGGRTCVAVPLSQGHCPVLLFSFLIPAGPSGLICARGPVSTASWRVSEGSPGGTAGLPER